MNKPLLSIVIANYNYGRFLDEAIQSVIAQDMGDKVELIIVDGGSTDNSVEIIQKYANGLPPNISYTDWINSSNHNSQTPPLITWWCSEKDGGQSDAFNKGFAHARGRFLTWLNADDVMLPGAIGKLKQAADRYPKCEWFVGGVLWLDPQMRILNCGRGRPFSEIRYREGNVSVWGPSSFFTKRLIDAVGGVDVRFHYTMDTDLWLRFACKANARYRPFCDYAWGLRLHPAAKMSRHNFLAVMDAQQMKAEEQKQRENEWRKEYFVPRASGLFSRLLSVSWRQVLMAKFDLWRYRGKHYLEFF